MNTLFEQYIGRMMRKALAGSDLSVHLQGGRMFCLESVDDGRRVFQTRPDILIKRGAQCVHIIDTKWKKISSRIDDQKQGISQGDVYQMMAYGQIYRSAELTLLYPHHAGLKSAPGHQSFHLVEGGLSRLMTASVDLADTGAIKAMLKALVVSGIGDQEKPTVSP